MEKVDLGLNTDQIIVGHQGWRNNEITKGLRAAVVKHKESFIKYISANANSEISSEQIRYAANGVKTCDAVLALIDDPKLLLAKLNNP